MGFLKGLTKPAPINNSASVYNPEFLVGVCILNMVVSRGDYDSRADVYSFKLMDPSGRFPDLAVHISGDGVRKTLAPPGDYIIGHLIEHVEEHQKKYYDINGRKSMTNNKLDVDEFMPEVIADRDVSVAEAVFTDEKGKRYRAQVIVYEDEELPPDEEQEEEEVTQIGGDWWAQKAAQPITTGRAITYNPSYNMTVTYGTYVPEGFNIGGVDAQGSGGDDDSV